jgi:hypothetical protein
MLHDDDKFYYMRTTIMRLVPMSGEDVLRKLIDYFGAKGIHNYLKTFYGFEINNNADKDNDTEFTLDK